MDVFAILDKDVLDSDENGSFSVALSVYSDKTNDMYPYFQNNTRYAVCPACGNPVTFVALVANENVDETGKRSPYAKHHKFSVPGLASYDQVKYDSCPLSSRNMRNRNTPVFINKGNRTIEKLLDERKIELRIALSEIIGVIISKDSIDKLITTFKVNRGCYAVGITPSNLPYRLLEIVNSLSLKGRYLNDLTPNPVLLCINQSEDFIISDANRIQSVVDDDEHYSRIFIQFYGWRRISSAEEAINRRIFTKNNVGEEFVLSNARIPLDLELFNHGL